MTRPDIKHAGMTDFYPFLCVGPVMALARIALLHQLVDVEVHFVPEHLPAQLVYHHLLPQMRLVSYV